DSNPFSPANTGGGDDDGSVVPGTTRPPSSPSATASSGSMSEMCSRIRQFSARPRQETLTLALRFTTWGSSPTKSDRIRVYKPIMVRVGKGKLLPLTTEAYNIV
ncbi:hypothetical protein GP486_008895, partial [Trichoglossum hirsutum]